MAKAKEFLMAQGMTEIDALNVIAETEELIWQGKWEEAEKYLGMEIYELI